MSRMFTYEEREAIARVKQLAEENHASVEEVVHQIEDFSYALESEIRDQLAALGEPVFTNPTTGKAASSVHAVLLALDYDLSVKWPELVKKLRRNGGSAIFFRRDLPKTSSNWATICIDLDQVEDLLPAVQPRKAPKVINAFKNEHGLS